MLVTRSGIPKVLRLTAVDKATATLPQATILSGTPTTWISIRNRGAQAIRVYFTAADFTNNVNFAEVPSTEKFDMPIELGGTDSNIGLFLAGDGADCDFTLVYAQRLA